MLLHYLAKRGNTKITYFFQLDCVTHTMHLCAIFLKEKIVICDVFLDAISGFPVSPGSAEALVRCGGKIKFILITYFLGNIYAKNCHNRTVYVKIIASFKGGTFFLETQCIYVAARCYTQRSRPHFVYIYTRWQFIMTGQAVTQA